MTKVINRQLFVRMGKIGGKAAGARKCRGDSNFYRMLAAQRKKFRGGNSKK